MNAKNVNDNDAKCMNANADDVTYIIGTDFKYNSKCKCYWL